MTTAPDPANDLRITMTLNGVTFVRVVPRVTLLLNPDAAVKNAAEIVWRHVKNGDPSSGAEPF